MKVPVSDRRRASTAWSIAIIACVAFACLGLAEQGSRGARLDAVPQSPLPFPRHEVVGIDLRNYSSLEAVQWLEAAGSDPFALLVVSVDADIVQALSSPEQETAAIEAMDRLVAAAGTSPIAACLGKPPETIDAPAVAQASTDTLIERYPDRIAYVAGCGPDDESWHRSIMSAIGANVAAADGTSSLVPLAAGAQLTIVQLSGPHDVGVAQAVVATQGSRRYTLLTVDIVDIPDAALLARATDVIEEVAVVGLVLVAPASGVDPIEFASVVRGAGLASGTLPEGFSSVTGPGISVVGEWTAPIVGTVRYARTSANDAAMSVEFVGTEIYVQGLASPDGGRVFAWVDPEMDDVTTPPDAILNFEADQAADVALPVQTNLPASMHRLVVLVQAEPDETVSLSGFIATGSVMPTWTTRMAATALLAVAVAATAERAYSSIRGIRLRNSRSTERRPSRHPRVFNRSR